MEIIAHKHNRIDILDGIRGFAIIAMVVYHGLYDLQVLFNINIGPLTMLSILEPPFAGAFILLAGVSSLFSHNNWMRALKVLLLAAAVTVATYLITPQEAIWFGILHFMGVAILLYALIRPVADKIPKIPAFILWSFLFIITYTLPTTFCIGIPGLIGVYLPASMRTVPGLFWLGLPDVNFSSGDYFPLMPWFFLFMAGTVLGVPIRDKKLPERFYTLRVPFFAAAGRNTLLIYALHQPVLYGLFTLIFNVLHW